MCRGLCPKTYIGRSIGTQQQPSGCTESFSKFAKTFEVPLGAVPSKSRGVHSPCRFDSDLRHQIPR